MANSSPYDGTGWATAQTPSIDEVHGNAYREIYDLRLGVKTRMDKEHVALATSSAGGELAEGAARAWVQDAAPTDTNSVSGVSLAANGFSEGRLWADSNDSYVLRVYEETTPGFQKVAPHVDGVSLELSSNAAQIKDGGVTAAKYAAGTATEGLAFSKIMQKSLATDASGWDEINGGQRNTVLTYAHGLGAIPSRVFLRLGGIDAMTVIASGSRPASFTWIIQSEQNMVDSTGNVNGVYVVFVDATNVKILLGQNSLGRFQTTSGTEITINAAGELVYLNIIAWI